MSASTPKTASFEGDNPVLGILLMVLFCMLIPFSDCLSEAVGRNCAGAYGDCGALQSSVPVHGGPSC